MKKTKLKIKTHRALTERGFGWQATEIAPAYWSVDGTFHETVWDLQVYRAAIIDGNEDRVPYVSKAIVAQDPTWEADNICKALELERAAAEHYNQEPA